MGIECNHFEKDKTKCAEHLHNVETLLKKHPPHPQLPIRMVVYDDKIIIDFHALAHSLK